jgi:glycosyltransferase involved in cell wall biosynthesis
MDFGKSMEASSKIRVAAVFATMNRSHVAHACVRALIEQSCAPDLVVVADNASSDDTVHLLNHLTDLPFELVVLSLPENVGNAGGVDAAMECAFQRGIDAVWILDDDSFPTAGALRALLEDGYDPQVVRHSMQIDPKTNRFTWPLWVANADKTWSLAWQVEDLPDDQRVVTRGMWTGALVSKEVREAVGPVNGELFIRGEDEEYPWRIEKSGFSFEGRCRAVLDHPGPADLIQWSIFGKHLFFERGLADWKLYYKVRNMVWLQQHTRGKLRAAMMALAYGVIGVKVDGYQRLPLLWEAICDGWSGRLGKWERHP